MCKILSLSAAACGVVDASMKMPISDNSHTESHGLRACSACRGDYEDPERELAGDAEGEGESEDSGQESAERTVQRERVPVREE